MPALKQEPGTPATAPRPRISLRVILENYSQGTADNAACTVYIRNAWKTQNPMRLADEIVQEMQRVLFAPVNTLGLEKPMDFISQLVAAAPTDNEECTNAVEALLEELVQHTHLVEPVFRKRAVLTLAKLLRVINSCGAEAMDSIVAALKDRLEDRVLDIRKASVEALARCVETDEETGLIMEGDEVITAFQKLLKEETAQGVLTALITHWPLDATQIGTILALTHDAVPEVRAAVYVQLAKKTNSPFFTIAQRTDLVHRGLTDTHKAVVAAAQHLVSQWWEKDCNKDVVALLALLDVQHCPGAAEAVLDALLEVKALDPLILLRQQGLRKATHQATAGGEGALVSPETAVLWRVVCLQVQSEADQRGSRAAEAAAGHNTAEANKESAYACAALDALETFLPETASGMVDFIAAHARTPNPAHRFAAHQLLAIATRCIDWVEASAQRSAMQLVGELVALDPRLLADPAAPDSINTANTSSPGSTNVSPLLSWEGALVGLASQALPDPGALATQLLALIKDVAMSWGLLGASGNSHVLGAEAAQLLQCARVLGALWRALVQHTKPLPPSWGELPVWCVDLMAAGAEEGQHGAVREASIHALATAALLPAGKATALPKAALCAFHTAQSPSRGDPRPQMAAVSALSDLLLVYGCAAVNSGMWAAEVGGSRNGAPHAAAAQPAVSDIADQLAGVDLEPAASNLGGVGGGGGAGGDGVGRDAQGGGHVFRGGDATQALVQALGVQLGREGQGCGSEAVAVAAAEGLARLLFYRETHLALAQAVQAGSTRGLMDEHMAVSEATAQAALALSLRAHVVCSGTDWGRVATVAHLLWAELFGAANPARRARNLRLLPAAAIAAARSGLRAPLGPRTSAAPKILEAAKALLDPPHPSSTSMGGRRVKREEGEEGEEEGGDGRQGQDQGHLGQDEEGGEPGPCEDMCRLCLFETAVTLREVGKLSVQHKAYCSALVEAATQLPFSSTHTQQASHCAALAAHCAHTLTHRHGATGNKTLAKTIEGARTRFTALVGGGVEGGELSDEEVTALLQLLGERLAGVPGAASASMTGGADDYEGATTATAATASTKARRVPRARKAAVKKEVLSEEESEQDEDAHNDGSNDEAAAREDQGERGHAGAGLEASGSMGSQRPSRRAAATARSRMAATVIDTDSD